MDIDLKAVLGSYAQLTIFLLMFSIGLEEGFKNLSLLWRQTPLLIRCLIASYIVVPLSAMLILRIVPIDTSARIAVGAMAICPGAPLTHKKLTGMKASSAMAGSFQTTTSLFAIILVPVWITIFNGIYPNQATVAPSDVFQQVMTVQFIPILLGLTINKWFPSLAENLSEPVRKISSIMFLSFAIILLVVALPMVLKVGVVTVIGVLLFITAAILAGHYLGGPEPETRLAIGLANSTRNAGLALALVTANFPDRPSILSAIAAIALLAFVAGAIYASLYRSKITQSVTEKIGTQG